MFRKTATFIILLSVLSAAAYAQSFEGIIEFKKQTGKNTVDYVYYVKDDKVRIDEFAPGTRDVPGSFIVDTKAGTMKYLNHDRKMWGTRTPKGGAAAPAGCAVTSTKNNKEMFGYKCTEQIVRNTTDSSQISYYLAPGKFTFFTPMMKLLNRQEKFSTYFFALTVKDGVMPLLAIERDLRGNEKGRLEVTRLEQKTLSAGLFDIPNDYTEVK